MAIGIGQVEIALVPGRIARSELRFYATRSCVGIKRIDVRNVDDDAIPKLNRAMRLIGEIEERRADGERRKSLVFSAIELLEAKRFVKGARRASCHALQA